MNKIDVMRQYSPLALAYLGDGVYELYVRNHVLRQRIHGTRDDR